MKQLTTRIAFYPVGYDKPNTEMIFNSLDELQDILEIPKPNPKVFEVGEVFEKDGKSYKVERVEWAVYPEWEQRQFDIELILYYS